MISRMLRETEVIWRRWDRNEDVVVDSFGWSEEKVR